MWCIVAEITTTSFKLAASNTLPAGGNYCVGNINWTAISKNNQPNGSNTIVDYGTSVTEYDGLWYSTNIVFNQTFSSPPIVTATPIENVSILIVIETTNVFCKIISAGSPGDGSFAIVQTQFNWSAVLDVGSSGGNLTNLKVDYGSFVMGANPSQVLFNIPFTSAPNIQLSQNDAWNYIFTGAISNTAFDIYVVDFNEGLPLYQTITWRAIL
jgi:hypothetical protein